MKLSRQSGRQEGKVVSLLPTPENASYGFIEVTDTSDQVFFHQRESEITASDMKRISVGTKVQFSIAINRKGDKYIAKDFYIQVSVDQKHISKKFTSSIWALATSFVRRLFLEQTLRARK